MSGEIQRCSGCVDVACWSNYQMGKYSEAAAFYKQCLSFGGIYKSKPKELAAIKAEHGIQE